MKRSLKERFLAKVTEEPNTGCWLWKGYLEPGGYGVMSMPGNRGQSAHRVAWKLFRGEIPAGLFVCHKCDVRNCVNPEHLFLCNPAENAADMKAKGRSRCGERNGVAKLTAKEVEQIRAFINEGSLSIGAIAERFNVSRPLVYAIRQRKIWRGPDGGPVKAQLESYRKHVLERLEGVMAEFEPAFDFVMSHEDPGRSGKVTEDAGGRTRFGIAQKFHPELSDEFFASPKEDALKQAEEIMRRDYWERMRLGEIANQNVANKLFDMAVNMGVHQAGVYAQRAANGMMQARREGAQARVPQPQNAQPRRVLGAPVPVPHNPGQALTLSRLTEDGVIGDKSLAAINGLEPIGYYQLLCDFSRQHYLHVAALNQRQAENLEGWLKRAAA